MLKHRVIPSLLLSRGGLVKTERFRKPSYVGDPINAIRIFNDKEADELMVLDIDASREGREPDYALIEQFAGECFMPLSYGGGIRTLDQARRLLALGVEKVCLQTAALVNPRLVSEIAERGGNQAVVVSIDVKRNWRRKPMLYSASARRTLDRPWIVVMHELVAAGAGEVLLTAVDRDGTRAGMDIELIREAARQLRVPLIAAGGVGHLDHIAQAIAAGASAVAAGAFFVWQGPHRAVLITYPSYTELTRVLAEASS